MKKDIEKELDEMFDEMIEEMFEAGLFDDLICDDECDECDDCGHCEGYDVFEDKEDINEAFKLAAEDLKYYYNPEKQVFTIVNPGNPYDKAVVKKHKEDDEDMEKAMLYCLLKFIGIKPSTLFKIMEKVQIQQKAGE